MNRSPFPLPASHRSSSTIRRAGAGPVLAIALAALLLSGGRAAWAADPAPGQAETAAPRQGAVEAISPQALQERLAGPDAPFVLDVREPHEYAGGHIAGSTLIPLKTLEGRLDALPREQAIAVVCHSGRRSAKAAKILAEAGFRVLDMQGGMQAWEGPLAE